MKIPENRWSAVCGTQFIGSNSGTGDAGPFSFCEKSGVQVGSRCHPTSKVRHVLTSFNWSKAKDTEVEQEFPKCMQVVEHMFPEFCIIS